MTRVKLPRSRRAWWLTGGAALVLLGGGGLAVYQGVIEDDDVCCAQPPPLYNVPRGPDGEIDVASQSVSPKVLVDHDFSLHIRPGGEADDWRLVESGEPSGVVRAKGIKTVKGTRYFRFRALKAGEARIVLKEIDGERTMTYSVEVQEDDQLGGSVNEDPEQHSVDQDELDFPKIDAGFKGTVTLRPLKTVHISNRYDNQPGYTWKVVQDPDPSVAVLETAGRPGVSGNPAAARTDWYKVRAEGKGTTSIKLFGCYRCERGKPETAESKRFSVTKTLKIVVR